MKTNKNLFMMLFVLALGSVGTVQAGKNCAKCAQVKSVVHDNDESFVREMHSIENCIHTIRKLAKDSSQDSSFASLDALSSRVDALAAATTEDHVILQGHRIEKLRDKISNARSYVQKHGKKSSRTNSDNVAIQKTKAAATPAQLVAPQEVAKSDDNVIVQKKALG